MRSESNLQRGKYSNTCGASASVASMANKSMFREWQQSVPLARLLCSLWSVTNSEPFQIENYSATKKYAYKLWHKWVSYWTQVWYYCEIKISGYSMNSNIENGKTKWCQAWYMIWPRERWRFRKNSFSFLANVKKKEKFKKNWKVKA